MNVLHIVGNPRPVSESTSKQLSLAFIQKLMEINPDINITNVDLYNNPPPYLSSEAINYFWKPLSNPGYKPTAAEEKAAHYARTQSTQLLATDVLVITTPMWGNTIPAITKAWLDQVLQPGLLFNMTAEGCEPLHKLKKIVVLVSSGGVFDENDPDDCLSPLFHSIFEYLGVEDITFAWADGQSKEFYEDADERKAIAIEAAQDLAEDVAEMAVEDAPAVES